MLFSYVIHLRWLNGKYDRLGRMGLIVVLFGTNVADVVPWVSVEALLQALLIHVVTDESNAATEHEEWVDGSDVDVFLRFLAKNCEKQSD